MDKVSPPIQAAGSGPQSRREAEGTLQLEAFDELYEEHFDLVWRVLQRMGVAAPALDDALQDVFLVAYRRRQEFEGRSSLKTWIVGITLRVGMDYLRRQRPGTTSTSRRTQIDEADWPDDTAPSPFDAAARSEAVRQLYALLDELDSDKRIVFILSEIEGMAIHEIASALGGNVNTIGSRLKAARRHVEAALRRHRAKDSWRYNPA